MVSEGDKARIADAIHAAEARTSGEIFCIIASRSSEYRMVPLAWAAIIALIVPLLLIRSTTWSATTIYVIQIVVFVAAWFGLSRPGLRFLLVPPRMKRDRAHAEAMRQFRAQGLYKIGSRIGVLIFASVAERYAEIVADAGIGAKVDPDMWREATDALIRGIKRGQPGDAFVAAIAQCGAVLAAHFPPGAINPDEVPDKLVEI